MCFSFWIVKRSILKKKKNKNMVALSIYDPIKKIIVMVQRWRRALSDTGRHWMSSIQTRWQLLQHYCDPDWFLSRGRLTHFDAILPRSRETIVRGNFEFDRLRTTENGSRTKNRILFDVSLVIVRCFIFLTFRTVGELKAF